MTAAAGAPPLFEGPIWAIGAGNMGGAMLRRWLASGLDPAQLTVIRRADEAFADGVMVLRAPPPDGAAPALLLLAVKPQMLDEVAPALAPIVDAGTLIVSILAGVELASLRARFPKAGGIVRAMPNTPVAIGRGVVALAAEAARDPRLDRLMEPLGLVEWIVEAEMDAATALAGSGPAFLFRFVDALARAGQTAGLPQTSAARMALATVAGAGLLAEATAQPPRRLAERVASPGGSTRKGLDVLDQDGALDRLLRETIEAAVRRNGELAAAAR